MSDGYHIGLLIMSVLQKIAPEFIKEGRLCWLRTPLYIVNSAKEVQYYYNDNEYNNAKNKIKGEITRCKGLAELGAERAKESMFSEKFQRMDVMEYSPEAEELLYNLMGIDVMPRKNFIFENVDFSTIRE